MAGAVSFNVQVDGLLETIRSFQGLDRELERPLANRELRQAAGDCAGGLAGDLRAAASSSSVPVARRVAASIRVKSDRLPSVTIGGSARVGRHGARAAVLAWGSEHGPAAGASVNHFAVGRSRGHWIAPTVERFKGSTALRTYQRAVYLLLRRWDLV
jgi:hypothetical protein